MNLTPDRVALRSGGVRLTYAEMESEVRLAVRRIRSLGVVKGDTVALLAGNSIDWAILAHAIPRIGSILMPLNVRLAPEEVRDQVVRSHAVLILREEGLDVPTLPCRVLTIDELQAVDRSDRAIPHGTRTDRANAGAPGADRAVNGAIPASPDPNRPCALLFTSGTTGRPKGVVLTGESQIASANACAWAIGLSAHDRWLICMPLFHVGGLSILHRCALHGACAILHEGFDPARVNAEIDSGDATILSVVGVMLRRILDDRCGRALPTSLRAVIVGGGPVEPDLIAACPQAIATYGLTETCSMVTLVPPGAPVDERASAGRALPGIEIRVVDDAGGALPAGANGAIEVRGPVVMRGYLGEPPLDPRGWFRTGDLGCLDDAGFLRLAGRREDLIISGGENVYPAEIESVLLGHPGVLDAVVVGKPDPTWGEVPLAFVVLRDRELSIAAIEDFLEGRLARFKVPKIALVPLIPRLANGKPDRARILAGADR